MTNNNSTYLTQLHQLLNEHFNLAEIRDLCFRLNVDYESVAGDEKPSRIRELLLRLGRNGRLPDLITTAQQQRPHVDWPPVPDDFQLPELVGSETAVPANQYHVYGDVVQGDLVLGDKIMGDNIGGDKIVKVEVARGPSPFGTAHSFFRRFERLGRLFNHTWSLVGRQTYIQQLNEFIHSDQQIAAILSGRGGIGKTKLLHAFSQNFEENHPEINLYFVFDNVPLSLNNIEDLPESPCLIVLDDAHRNEDALKALLVIAERRAPLTTKLLLSSRPQGVDQIKSLLTRTGYDPREILSLEPLGNLEKDNVLELARLALGNDDEILAEQLASATRDCPLVTVVGGQLLAQKSISPSLLERDIEFQDVVLSRFREEIVGNMECIDPSLIRRLLTLIAALNPIQPMTRNFQDVASKFLGITSSELLDTINKLQESGVLISRGYAFRITPDVLSDHILHEACFTPEGILTGFAQQVFEQFSSLYPSQALRNLAELDWRVLQTTGHPPNLLSDIWQDIMAQFRDATNEGRRSLLQILKDVAYFQPRPMLELVEIAIHEPAAVQESENTSPLFYTHANSLSDIPEILRLIGFTLDYLPRCCDLLWELGRDDSRKLHPHPNHALRILTELASYDIGKPLSMNQIVLESAARWLLQPDAHSYVNHPLDVIDPLLAKSGEAIRSYSDRVTFHPFAVNLENTQHLRERALQLVIDCAQFDNLRAILRALDSLESTMRGSFGLHGRQISEEERARWVPERMTALNYIVVIAERTGDAIIHWRIIEVLQRELQHPPSEGFKTVVEKTVNSIPETFELRLMRTLCANAIWDWAIMPENPEEANVVRREYNQKMANMRQDMVQEFVEKYPDPAEGFTKLNEFLSVLEKHDFRPNDRQFIMALLNHSPEYIVGITSELMNSPDCYLVNYFDLFLNGIRNFDELKGIELAKEAVASGVDKLILALAHAYRWGSFWAKAPASIDIDIFNQLVNNTNLQVREKAISSLKNLGRVEPRLALSLLHSIDIGNEQSLAMELVQIFDDGQWSIAYNNLSDEDIHAILQKLEEINEIEDYHINIFLQYASRRLPVPIMQFLLQRVKRGGDFSYNYHPVPITGFKYALDGFIKSENYAEILREIRKTSVEEIDKVPYWLPRLYKEVSSDFHPTSLSILQEWIDSDECPKIVAAIQLLQEAPEDFIFKHEKFVISALEKAYAAGGDCYAQVASGLSHSVRFGLRSGASGQPFPQDVTLRDKAIEVRKRHNAGSLGYRFYDELAKLAENKIHQAQREDEE